jgi:hypothetical protein
MLDILAEIFIQIIFDILAEIFSSIFPSTKVGDILFGFLAVLFLLGFGYLVYAMLQQPVPLDAVRIGL